MQQKVHILTRLIEGSRTTWTTVALPSGGFGASRPKTALRSVETTIFSLGLFSVIVYALGIVARYPLARELAHPEASWGVLAQFSYKAGLIHALVYALLTLIYGLALHLVLAHRSRGTTRWLVATIVGVWLLASGVLLGAYPGESSDIFDYLFRGRLQTEFGVSPLVVVPSHFPMQPFYSYVHWTDHVDTYGPLWEGASHLVAATVGLVTRGASADQSLLTIYVTSYRLFAIMLTGVCGVLIALIVRRQTPRLVPAALLAWFWNPLLLTASAVGGHNDMLLLACMLLAFLLLHYEHWLLSLLALVLAAHVKITALLLVPLVGVWLLRRCGWWATLCYAAATLALALPLSWLLYAPFGGWSSLPRMLDERVRYIANSLAYPVYWLLQVAGWSERVAWRATTQGAVLLFFTLDAVLLWHFWRATRQPCADSRLLWRAATALTLLYLLVGSFWFQHWYVLWALASAALLPNQRLMRIGMPAISLLVLWLHLAVVFLVPPGTPLNALPTGLPNISILVCGVALLIGIGIWWLCWQIRRLWGGISTGWQERTDVDSVTTA